jgi:hypothetical protein
MKATPWSFMYALHMPVLLGCLCLPVLAVDKTVHISAKGVSAQATWEDTDPSGCVSRHVHVFAANGKVSPGSDIGPVQILFAQVFRQDECTGSVLLDASVFLTLPDKLFQIKNNMSTATLAATVEAHDAISGQDFPLAINLTWTPNSDTFPYREREKFASANGGYVLLSYGKARTAVAGGAVTLLGENVTPRSSDFGQMNLDGFNDLSFRSKE